MATQLVAIGARAVAALPPAESRRLWAAGFDTVVYYRNPVTGSTWQVARTAEGQDALPVRIPADVAPRR